MVRQVDVMKVVRNYPRKPQIDVERRCAEDSIRESKLELAGLLKELESQDQLTAEERTQFAAVLQDRVQRCDEELFLLRAASALQDVPETFILELCQLQAQGFMQGHEYVSGFSPMHFAAQNGRRDIIEYMLRLKGGKEMLNFRDATGKTPLAHAERIRHGVLYRWMREEAGATAAPNIPPGTRPDVANLPRAYVKVLEQVEQQGWANMNWKDDFSMLHWAAEKGRLDLCNYLLALEADPNAMDKKARAPIELAAEAGHTEVQAFFEELETNPRNHTLKLAVFQEGVHTRAEIMGKAKARHSLLGTNSNHPSEAGNSSESGASSAQRMKRAIPAAYLQVMEQIDVSGWGKMTWTSGFSLLHWAAKNDFPDLCARFMWQGADPSHPDDLGKDAFQYARDNSSQAALQQLERGRPDQDPLDTKTAVGQLISDQPRRSKMVQGYGPDDKIPTQQGHAHQPSMSAGDLSERKLSKMSSTPGSVFEDLTAAQSDTSSRGIRAGSRASLVPSSGKASQASSQTPAQLVLSGAGSSEYNGIYQIQANVRQGDRAVYIHREILEYKIQFSEMRNCWILADTEGDAPYKAEGRSDLVAPANASWSTYQGGRSPAPSVTVVYNEPPVSKQAQSHRETMFAQSVPRLLVSGAGTASVNGLYDLERRTTQGERPVYQHAENQEHKVQFSTTRNCWIVDDIEGDAPYKLDYRTDMIVPLDATWSIHQGGLRPAPSVSEAPAGALGSTQAARTEPEARDAHLLRVSSGNNPQGGNHPAIEAGGVSASWTTDTTPESAMFEDLSGLNSNSASPFSQSDTKRASRAGFKPVTPTVEEVMPASDAQRTQMHSEDFSSLSRLTEVAQPFTLGQDDSQGSRSSLHGGSHAGGNNFILETPAAAASTHAAFSSFTPPDVEDEDEESSDDEVSPGFSLSSPDSSASPAKGKGKAS